MHVSLYQKALDTIDDLEEVDYYVCFVYGYTSEVEPPDTCRACNARFTAFFKGT